jgi:hypothetical protein
MTFIPMMHIRFASGPLNLAAARLSEQGVALQLLCAIHARRTTVVSAAVTHGRAANNG